MEKKFDKLNLFPEEPIEPFWNRMRRSIIYVIILFIISLSIGLYMYNDKLTAFLFSFGISMVFLIQQIAKRNGYSGIYFKGDNVVDQNAESDKIFEEIKKNNLSKNEEK